MKKSKIQAGLIITVLCMLICGCGGKSESKSVNINADNDDSQPYWNDSPHRFAKGEGGYYFIVDNKICFFDSTSEEVYPVCGKAQCEHNDDSCDAYLADEYLYEDIYYYNNKIYVQKYDEKKGEIVLVECTKDCTQRKDLFVTSKISHNPGNGGYELIFHNGFVYMYNVIGEMTFEDDNNVSITRFALDGSGKETIYTAEYNSNTIAAAKSYGNYLMFINVKRTRKGDIIEAEFSGILGYNYETGEVSTLLEGQITDYSYDMDNQIMYYYVFNDGLYKKNMNTENVQKIYQCEDDNRFSQISFDGNNIYLTNLRMQTLWLKSTLATWIIDTDGKVLNKLPVKWMYFGDENYMFGRNDNNEVIAVKKENVSTISDSDWKVLGK